MKQLLIASLLFASTVGTAGTAMAGNGHSSSGRTVAHRFTEYADVTNVQPIYKDVSLRDPKRECWIEQQQHVIRHDRHYNSNPRRHGHNNPGRHYSSRGHSGADTVVGGIIGGVIGNQLGRNAKRGTRAGATIAGAIIGSAIANEAHGSGHRQRRHHYSNNRPHRTYESRPVERCRETVATRYEQRLQGYNVTYRYRGQTHTTYMKRDPGRRIELQVSVKPARH